MTTNKKARITPAVARLDADKPRRRQTRQQKRQIADWRKQAKGTK